MLVILVVFLFLGNWRATLIPAIAIPVSLIGTFAFMLATGMSINTVSLFGLILAIGVVVDDAIIVIENTERHVREGKVGKEAALATMREVTGPVIATTLVLLAVFVPVTLMPGISGSLYRQFAMTISVAVLISSINALTLSPALAGLLLTGKTEPRGLLGKFSNLLDRATEGYQKGHFHSVRRLGLSIGVYAALCGVIYLLLVNLPGGFVPDEDKGAFFVDVQLPDGASLQRTREVTDKVNQILMADPDVAHVIIVNGYSMLKGVTTANSAMAIAVLKDWDERPGPAADPRGHCRPRIQGQLLAIPEAMAMVFAPPALPGVGSVSGLDYRLLDELGRPPEDLAAVARTIVAEANAAPQSARPFSPFAPPSR